MKTKKKRSSPKIQEFFSRNLVKTKKGPNIIQRSDVDQSQIIGGGGGAADVDHSQTIGGYTPIPPAFFAPLKKTYRTNVRYRSS